MAFSSIPATFDPESVPTDKWRLASQIQKAIRHGRADAAAWAVEKLAQVDPAYLRYRLSVIAVEDVGAGQASRVVDVFSSGWGKKAVEARGGVDFLRAFAVEAAAGVKDRLPCDWMGCSKWLPDFEAHLGSWAELDEKRARDIAFDRSQPWWMRGLAGWRAAGTERFSSGFLPRVAGDWETWKHACAEFSGEDVVVALMAVGQHQREAHPVFLGMALAERGQAGCEIVQDRLPNLPDIGPWLSATFDKHTTDGKRAYRSWLATHDQARRWLEGRGLDAEGQLDAVGRLAFWLEGGQCDRHWTSALARQVLVDSKKRYLQSRNMNPQAFATLCVDPTGWHEARRSVVEVPILAARSTSWRG